MNGDEIRDSFIKFFEGKGHLHMPSASLIPAGDPTLLFTSAGMVPFKPFFTGEQNPPAKRLLRADYVTFNPAQWGRHTDMARFLFITLDRDLTREETNTWAGKYTPAVFGADPEPEHVPKWVHYPDDLVLPGHEQQRRRVKDSLAAGTTADVRDPGRIIKVAAGRPDTIIRTRMRRGDGTVILPDRIDADPVRMRRQS